MKNAYRIFIRNSAGKDHFEDQGVDGKNYIGMDLRETGWKALNWIHLAQDRDWWQAFVNMVMNLQVP
jgi:hypothetical protein